MNNFFYLLSKCIFALFIFISIPTISQTISTDSIKELIVLTDEFYGSDDRLLNGTIKATSNITIKGHPFFLSDEWMEGDIFMNGVEFKKVSLKYNIEIDEIIYKGKAHSWTTQIIALNKNLIDSIRIDKHLFVNSSKLPIENPMGFIEVLYRGSFTSYLKHEIQFVERVSSNSYLYNEYQAPKISIFIYRNNELTRIKTKKDLLNYFAPFQNEINKFIRKNKVRFNKADHNQLYSLLTFCDEILSSSK